MELDTIICGDALTVACTLPDESVNCIITSPPYFGLRDYGVEGQIGLEDTSESYILRLAQVFRELRRVLRKDGVFYLNLGDSYVGTGDKGDYKDPKYANGRNGQSVAKNRKNAALGSKQRLMIPARVALALQADGWILRDEIVWAKDNPMPESVKDRTTKAHEMIYMFSKSRKYHYDIDAIKEPANEAGREYTFTTPYKIEGRNGGKRGSGNEGNGKYLSYDYRNRRSVWNVNTEPTPFAHFATMPTALVEIMIKAGCPKGGVVYDPFAGAGTTLLVAQQLNRRYLGSELNPEYVKLATMRIAGRISEYMAEQRDEPKTLYMFDIGD